MEEGGDGDVYSWWCLEELDFEREMKRKLKEVMMREMLEVECNAPIPRIRGRHCNVYT